MQLGRVIGQVVATRKEGKVDRLKIMVVRYLDDKLNETSKTAACVDTVQAGPGDVVLLCSSSSARMTAMTKGVCTDNAIVGIVDAISSGGQTLYLKSQNSTASKNI